MSSKEHHKNVASIVANKYFLKAILSIDKFKRTRENNVFTVFIVLLEINKFLIIFYLGFISEINLKFQLLSKLLFILDCSLC